MPIYEFKCSKCREYFELLVMSRSQDGQARCPKCDSDVLDRILSTTHHTVSGGSQPGIVSQARQCASGNCTTIDLPGPAE